MCDASYDSIVIGAGSGGLAFAETAARNGASVLMIERAELGGTCVNRGCVPKKILWSAGKLAKGTAAAAGQGISAACRVDFATLVDKRDTHIASIRASFQDTLSDAGVTILRGKAHVEQDGLVTVDGQTFRADNVILATGSAPTPLDILGRALLSDSADVLAWRTLPQDMVIVGGGYIGCEFAAIFNALGVSVTLVHDGAHILDTFDPALARHVQDGLVAAGIDVITDDSVTQLSRADGRLHYQLGEGSTGTADVVVAAIGRSPNIAGLWPISDILERADSGALAVDDTLATNVPGVFAIGDVADRLPLTPVATADGTALANRLHGDVADLIDLDLVATTTFVYPPAAFVGTVDDTARAGTSTPLEGNVLSPEPDHTSHMYRIGIDPNTQALTGAQFIAEGADEMIALAAALIASGASADVLRRATPVHPSFAEEFFVER